MPVIFYLANIPMDCTKNVIYLDTKKTCKHLNTEQKTKNHAQTDAHNLLLSFEDSDEQLLSEVFLRTAVDELSMVAKPIRCYGSRYLKCDRGKRLVRITSQKMRNFARLVIQMKKIEPYNSNLEDCLVPKYLDSIVKCTKIISGYNALNDKF